jgi:hypothetical protein
VQQLVAAWEGSEAAQAVKQHASMARTPSGVLALGKVRSGPVAGWARWVNENNENSHFCELRERMRMIILLNK